VGFKEGAVKWSVKGLYVQGDVFSGSFQKPFSRGVNRDDHGRLLNVEGI